MSKKKQKIEKSKVAIPASAIYHLCISKIVDSFSYTMKIRDFVNTNNPMTTAPIVESNGYITKTYAVSPNALYMTIATVDEKDALSHVIAVVQSIGNAIACINGFLIDDEVENLNEFYPKNIIKNLQGVLPFIHPFTDSLMSVQLEKINELSSFIKTSYGRNIGQVSKNKLDLDGLDKSDESLSSIYLHTCKLNITEIIDWILSGLEGKSDG